MLSFEQIKKYSKEILELRQAVNAAADERLGPINDAIAEDEENRTDMIAVHNRITARLDEYKEIKGYTKKNYHKETFNYYGGIYDDIPPVEDLEEVYAAAFLKPNNLFYHNGRGGIGYWDNVSGGDNPKWNDLEEINSTPQPRTITALNLHAGYDEWVADTTSQASYENEATLIKGIREAVNILPTGYDVRTGKKQIKNSVLVGPSHTAASYDVGVNISIDAGTEGTSNHSTDEYVIIRYGNNYYVSEIAYYNYTTRLVRFDPPAYTIGTIPIGSPVEFIGTGILSTSSPTEADFFITGDDLEDTIPNTTRLAYDNSYVVINDVNLIYTVNNQNHFVDNTVLVSAAGNDIAKVYSAVQHSDMVGYFTRYSYGLDIVAFGQQRQNTAWLLSVGANSTEVKNAIDALVNKFRTNLILQKSIIDTNVDKTVLEDEPQSEYLGNLITDVEAWLADVDRFTAPGLSDLDTILDSKEANVITRSSFLYNVVTLYDEYSLRMDLIYDRINKATGSLNMVYRAGSLVEGIDNYNSSKTNKLERLQNYMVVKKLVEDGTGNFYVKVEDEKATPEHSFAKGNTNVWIIDDNITSITESFTIKGIFETKVDGGIDIDGNRNIIDAHYITLNRKVSKSYTKDNNARLVVEKGFV